jgi:hypothetical protein
MRLARLLSLVTAAALVSACATRSQTAQQCPAPSGDQMYRAVVGSLDKAFGKRHLGYHVIQTARGSDAKGDIVLNLERIGPASEDQPEPGQGKRLVVVVQPCTGDVLRFYRP